MRAVNPVAPRGESQRRAKAFGQHPSSAPFTAYIEHTIDVVASIAYETPGNALDV
jgi:hypothetical protein